MSVKVVGRVARNVVKAFVLDGGEAVTFHTATLRNGSGKVTFYSDLNSWPSLVARRMGVDYSFMTNASDAEARQCIRDKGLKVIAETDV